MKEAYIHPKYDYRRSRIEYDFAVIALKNCIETFDDKIRPACLPKDESNDYLNEEVTVTGWGRLSGKGPQPRVLQETTLTVVSCGRMGEYAICGDDLEQKTGTCSGDSGGSFSN